MFADPDGTVVLKPGKEQSLLRFHPWVFSGAIKMVRGKVKEGSVVRVTSHDNHFLGLGHYQTGTITVRIFSFDDEDPDSFFWTGKILKAFRKREAAGLSNNSQINVYRLVHGEGDGLPGLIVDFYNGVAVMQMHSAGMFLIREILADSLREIYGNNLTAVYNKSEKTLPFQADLPSADGYLTGKGFVPHEVSEYGIHFRVDWETGQKTGFFIDQRENRKLLEMYSRERKVLNMFCYTGGFSAYAMRGEARTVHSVDSSERAIQLTRENIALNFPEDDRHAAFAEDASAFMRNMETDYDLIILDPPAFAKHQGALPQALRAYQRINARAIQQIRPGGILFTFSCSQIVTKEKFREAIFSAAASTGRSVVVLHQLVQPADHPVNIYHPEGEYLKGLVLYVE